MLLKKLIVALSAFSSVSIYAQTISIQPVEVIYGDRVYSGQHQVVTSTPESVAIIPAEKPKANLLANLVVSANPNRRSYLEEANIAKREQEIYSEVNRRTKEAPFTVLFTGHIPEEIQKRRLSMMPEVGIFGDQLEKLERDQAELHAENTPDAGDYSEVTPGNRVLGQPIDQSALPAEPSNQEELSNEQKLEQLIGG